MISKRAQCFRRNTVLLLFVFFSSASSLLAQLSQVARFETEHKNSSYDYTFVSMNERGIALIHQKDKYDMGKNFWEITLLDSALQQTWITELRLSNQLNLIGYEYAANELYFLYRLGTTDQGALHLIRIDTRNHEVIEYEIEPKLDFKLSYFSVVGNSALLGGYVARQPAIFLFDMITSRNKVVPGFFTKNTEMLDMRTNRNQTFNTLMLDRSTNEKKQLVIRTFDESGALLVDDLIAIDDDKTIISGLTSTLLRDELMVMGTWGQANGKVALGFFTVPVDPFNAQSISYYAFAEMNHFLEYNSPRKMARIKAKTLRRKKAGKLPSHGAYVNPARVVENPEGFVLLSEVYSPVTSTNSNQNWNYYSPYGNPYGYGSPYGFNNYGNRYSPYSYGSPIHRTDVNVKFSSVAFFDPAGKLKEDAGMRLEDARLPAIDQVSDFTYSQHHIFQVYRKNKDLVTATTSRDTVGVALAGAVKIKLRSPDDVLKNESDSDGALRQWYGPYFFVWGYETVKEKDEGTHHILYVNKFKAD